jgi:hypothetical protein
MQSIIQRFSFFNIRTFIKNRGPLQDFIWGGRVLNKLEGISIFPYLLTFLIGYRKTDTRRCYVFLDTTRSTGLCKL